ncbi:hypothetical protein Ddc_11308 [Ditylenchus destructor]|nr:hypothetical protein Ddc_11308 [Ditylenchus destructor]
MKSFVLRGGYCGYGGSYSPIIAIMIYPIIGSPIQFKFNEKTENSTEILHLLHLLWHIKDAVFIEKNCLLEFPLSRDLKALQASWSCGPLLKCTKSLELSDHAGFCGNIVPSSNEERLFVSPKIRINVSLDNMAFYSRRHFLRTMIQHYQQLSVDMPSDIDVSCGPLTMLVNPISDLVELCQIPDPEEYEQRDVLERRLDALGTGQNWVKCRDMAGEFSNACIRKTFHVLVHNCHRDFCRDHFYCERFRFYSTDIVE